MTPQQQRRADYLAAHGWREWEIVRKDGSRRVVVLATHEPMPPKEQANVVEIRRQA